ncbi:hypothetical protein [Actinoplanes solisilvae]|uniref:hypothetical protein n=1 Tax=Actinoplanes solisilvae TaxID=2486853 RepID=UPI001F0C1DA1|nr:hypothetical protein [Actinoplanes solisilvae]
MPDPGQPPIETPATEAPVPQTSAIETPAIDIGTPEPHEDDTPGTEPEQKPRGRVRRALIAVVLVLATAGLVTLAATSWRIFSQRDAKLEIKPQVGELSLDYSSEGAQTASYLQTALAAEVDLNYTAGAVYRESAEKSVLFLGGTGLLWTPSKDLESAMSLISDKEGAVIDLHDVEAGPLGGTMKCGITKSTDGDLTVCGWADHGSLAMALFNNRSPDDAAPLMLKLRNEIQSR